MAIAWKFQKFASRFEVDRCEHGRWTEKNEQQNRVTRRTEMIRPWIRDRLDQAVKARSDRERSTYPIIALNLMECVTWG